MAFAVNGHKDIFIAHDHKIAKLSYGNTDYNYSVLRDKTDDVIAMAVYDKSQRVNGKIWAAHILMVNPKKIFEFYL